MQHSNGSNFNEKYFLQNLISEFESRLIKIKVCVCSIYMHLHSISSQLLVHFISFTLHQSQFSKCRPLLSIFPIKFVIRYHSIYLGSSSFFRNKILYASLKHVLQRNNSKAKYVYIFGIQKSMYHYI